VSTTIKITCTNDSAAELRAVAARCSDGAQTRPLLVIAMILGGVRRLDDARQVGMDRQTLRDWVHRYSETGIHGLVSRNAPGRGTRPSRDAQT
jgi:transposase